ncbi:MAG: alkaline phosphatase family protein [Candidatus Cybelea sp.]
MTTRTFAAIAGALMIAACSSFDYAPSGRSAQDDTLGARSAQDDTVAAARYPGGDTSPAARYNRVILSGGAQRRSRRTSASPIQHVVFVIQENRSFNNLFLGFPGATTAKYGYDQTGKKIEVKARDLGAPFDLGHASDAYFAACDGTGKLRGTDCKMDGWSREGASGKYPPNPEYSYVPQKEIAPYWAMAQQYVLADNAFASNLDGSFIAHQYAVASYASHGLDFPQGPWGCPGGSADKVATLKKDRTVGPMILACFTNPTIASEADAAGVSWRFYAGAIGADGGIWSAYQADSQIYHSAQWKSDVVNPPSRFLKDVAKGKLASITWITPTFETSDHPGIPKAQGPAWVASVVDAVGASKFWNSTAIFVIWDDWGGMFDPVKPVFEDYDGLGFRVPLIMVSPYAKQGSVTHVQYETASVLRYIEDNFELGQLSKSDARANDPANDPAAFDYAQRPRKFKKIAGAKPASYWIELERDTSAEPKPALVLGDD